jgi:hypothetical protein
MPPHLALSLTDGNPHDITQAEALLGDKGYDTDSFNTLRKDRAQLSLAGCIWSAHSLGSNDERP